MASKRKRVRVERDDETSNIMAGGEQIQTIPVPNISRIRNKQKRSEVYREMKKQQAKIKIAEKTRKREEREALGDAAPPKQVPKTIESMRVFDETMVNPEDQEVIKDEAQDEMSTYFNRETTPKILITSSEKIRNRTYKFCKELMRIIPNSDVYFRQNIDLKKLIPLGVERGYTDLIVVNDDRKTPNGMVISHLPNGPTAHFKMTNVKLTTEIKKAGKLSGHMPEVILNNFNTRLGHSVGRMFASLFPHDPEFQGRRVMTFHNQRDYIFFRHHRYMFRNSKRVGLQELGPRFTLKLRSLQKGAFDSKFGEYEWVHKRHEMETSRRKFFL